MIEKKILPNGLRVILEDLPYLRSVSIGIWILTGSVHENETNSGISHFLEHMLFKGTEKRTAKQIAEELDSVGGELQAFTSREFTCYTAKVLDNHLPLALDVLHDMVVNSTFPPVEIEKEKGVVLEEISMHEDSPQELVHDLFNAAIWKNHSLGLSILGPEKNIKNFNRDKLMDFHKKNYCGNNIIITVAGNIDKDDLFKKIENYFSSIPNNCIDTNDTIPDIHTGVFIHKKKLEQIHFCMGTSGLNFSHPNRYTLYLLNSILGGSMSSRLFQSVRENHGLVYNIYSYQSSYREAGLFSIYAGTKETNFEKVIKIIFDELKNLKTDFVSEKELTNTKEQLKGGITLNLESTESRMGHLAKSEIYFKHHISLDEIFNNIDSVKRENILTLAKELFKADNIAMVIIGSLNEKYKDKINGIMKNIL
ncbi:insulinase family protein [Candidatus Poribacteria bacterium]|nr:insulinase family protein [Candidatus Poribacteria bacterium]